MPGHSSVFNEFMFRVCCGAVVNTDYRLIKGTRPSEALQAYFIAVVNKVTVANAYRYLVCCGVLCH